MTDTPRTDAERLAELIETWRISADNCRRQGDDAVSRLLNACADELAALLRARRGGAPQGWQAIATAPQDWSWFLAWGDDIGYIVYRSGPGLIAAEEPDPTHWMPLPAPPGEPSPAPGAAPPQEPDTVTNG